MKVEQKTTPGVIETLSTGFERVNRIAWVALFPILLDLFLWKGPQVSIAPAIRGLLSWYDETLTAQMGQSVGATIGDQAGQGIEQLRQMLEAIATQFNLLSLLAGNGPFIGMLPGIPSLGILDGTGPVTELALPLAIFGAAIVLLSIGILLGCFYLGLVAQQVRDGRIVIARLARDVWRYWLSTIGFLALLIGFGICVGIPAGLFVSVMLMISPDVAIVVSSLITMAFQLAVIMMILYFFFLADAIVISEVGPFRAMRNSARVVARNFWSAIALIGLTFIISYGTGEIWRYISAEPWGAVAGIIGNAYIATGLAAAKMMFYRNKLAAIDEAKSVIRGTGGL